MDYLYTQEHISCLSYEKEKSSLIEVLSIEKGQRKDLKVLHNKLFFLLSGYLCFSFELYSLKHLHKDQVLKLPADYNSESVTQQNCSLVIIRMKNHFQLTDYFSLEKLLNLQSRDYRHELTNISINKPLQDYLVILSFHISHGFLYMHFLDLKIKELFFILNFFIQKMSCSITFIYNLPAMFDSLNCCIRTTSKLKMPKNLLSYSIIAIRDLSNDLIRYLMFHPIVG